MTKLTALLTDLWLYLILDRSTRKPLPKPPGGRRTWTWRELQGPRRIVDTFVPLREPFQCPIKSTRSAANRQQQQQEPVPREWPPTRAPRPDPPVPATRPRPTHPRRPAPRCRPPVAVMRACPPTWPRCLNAPCALTMCYRRSCSAPAGTWCACPVAPSSPAAPPAAVRWRISATWRWRRLPRTSSSRASTPATDAPPRWFTRKRQNTRRRASAGPTCVRARAPAVSGRARLT